MNSGTVFVLFVVAGGLIGGLIGAIVYYSNAKKARAHFNIDKGMSYNQIIDILGEPMLKKPKGEKLICRWRKSLNGRQCYINILFVNDTVRNIF